MTKLMQWIFCGILFFSIWLPLATNKLNSSVLEKYSNFIVFFPVISLFLFGAYAAIVILYRVMTFNNCEDAAKELHSQIKEAKRDLTARGFVFKDC